MQKKIKKSFAVIISLLMIMTAIPFTPVAVATDGADPITEKDCQSGFWRGLIRAIMVLLAPMM